MQDVTRRGATGEFVDPGDARLRAVLDATPTGIAIVEDDGHSVWRNRAYRDLLGYSDEELDGLRLEELVVASDRALLSELRVRIASGESDVRSMRPVTFERRDGRQVQLSLTITRTPSEFGSLRVLNLRDVSEQASAERQLAEEEARFRSVFESASGGLLIIDRDGVPQRANPALLELFGTSFDELVRRTPERFVTSEQERFDISTCIESHLGGESGSCAQTVEIERDGDGQRRQVNVTCQSLVVSGEVRGVLVEFTDVTELLQAQQALSDREGFLRTTLEAVRSGVMVLSPEGPVLTANQHASELVGYSAEGFLEAQLNDIFDGEELALMQKRLASRVRGEEGPERTLVRARRRDGVTIDLDVRGAPLVEDGELRGVVVDFRDVTDELKLQRQVQETAERLNTVFETVSTGLAVWGLDRRSQTVNQAFSEITGYSPEELLDQTFDSLLHPDDLQMTTARFERRVAGERLVPHRVNVRALRKDGEEIVVDLRAEPFVVDGEIVGVVTEVRDVTEQLELQRQLAESADQISTILEATPDAIVVADDRQVILRVNAAAEEVFGVAPDDLVGRQISVLVGGADRGAHSDYVEHYRRTGEASTAAGLVIGEFREVFGRRFDGAEFPAELAVAETELSDGRKLFVAAIRDITARKLVEEELQRLNEELGERSRERQALVQQLLSAQEEERRTVAYDIHDGPAQELAAAQMFLEAYAFDQQIDVEGGEVEHLRRAMAYLTSGLTDTRRIMSGLRPALLDDVGLADALHELLREMTGRADVQLELRTSELIDPLSPEIEIALYRVAQEAGGNAVRHSGAGQLSVRLRSDGSTVCLQVSDDGNGFDESTVDGPRDGHHYGLAGMRERVELLGGEFRIESAPGLGTVITTTIPLSEAVE